MDKAKHRRREEHAKKSEMKSFLWESKADVDAGRTVPALVALDELAKKHKIRGRKT